MVERHACSLVRPEYKTLNAWKESETDTEVIVIVETEQGKRVRLRMPKCYSNDSSRTGAEDANR